MAMEISGSTIGVGRTKDLTLEESNPVDDGKTDDDGKLEEVVEKENLHAH